MDTPSDTPSDTLYTHSVYHRTRPSTWLLIPMLLLLITQVSASVWSPSATIDPNIGATDYLTVSGTVQSTPFVFSKSLQVESMSLQPFIYTLFNADQNFQSFSTSAYDDSMSPLSPLQFTFTDANPALGQIYSATAAFCRIIKFINFYQFYLL